MKALIRYFRYQMEVDIKLWWRDHKSCCYGESELKMGRKQPPELTLPREAYHRLVAARIGYGLD